MRRKHRPLGPILLLLGLSTTAACGPPSSKPSKEILANLDQHLGQQVTMKAQFRSGARCRQGEEGDWKTYCKDCQYCRGPYVIESTTTSTKVDDWPMILGGTFDGQDIRCKGPLNKVECFPFKLGKEYVVRGRIERAHPPKLMVQKFWEIK